MDVTENHEHCGQVFRRIEDINISHTVTLDSDSRNSNVAKEDGDEQDSGPQVVPFWFFDLESLLKGWLLSIVTIHIRLIVLSVVGRRLRVSLLRRRLRISLAILVRLLVLLLVVLLTVLRLHVVASGSICI